MKRSVRALATVASLAFLTCSAPIDMTELPLFRDGVYALQAFLTNGVTGEPVSGATMTVEVGQHTLNSASTGNHHTVHGIPPGVYPVIVSASGYLPFESVGLNFTGARAGTDLELGANYTYIFRNVVIYPVGTVAEDVTTRIFDSGDGEPINGATVILNLNASGTELDQNDDLTVNVLAPTSGLQPGSLSAQSNQTGTASFPGAQLVVGATYEVTVIGARNAAGELLALTTNTNAVKIGTSALEIDLFLAQPLQLPVVTSSSNELSDRSTSLTISFTADIALCTTDDDDHDYEIPVGGPPAVFPAPLQPEYNGMDGGATFIKANGGATPTANNVTSSVSGKDLSLTPNVENEGDTTTVGLAVRFTGVQVRLASQGWAGCTTLDAMGLRDTSAAPPVANRVNRVHVIRDTP